MLAVAMLLGAVPLLSACAVLQRGPVGNSAVPQPARSVELDRYLGQWFELARYDAGFQRDCDAVTADYSRRDDGNISVVNRCRRGGVNGRESVAQGRARIVADSQGARLRVSFFGPFWGDYWVLDRAEDYSWAIVGEPSGRYLWILARRADGGDAEYQRLVERARGLGYDTALLRRTRHAGGYNPAD